LLIEIRALQNIGTIMTESGFVNLTKGSITYMRRTEVEQFIREGVVEHVLNNSMS
jgi:hypothetical protein